VQRRLSQAMSNSRGYAFVFGPVDRQLKTGNLSTDVTYSDEPSAAQCNEWLLPKQSVTTSFLEAQAHCGLLPIENASQPAPNLLQLTNNIRRMTMIVVPHLSARGRSQLRLFSLLVTYELPYFDVAAYTTRCQEH
jgi:hypothetical protein